jgi:hypothetical protein
VYIEEGVIRLEHHRGNICVEKRTYTAGDLIAGNIDQALFNSCLGSTNITTPSNKIDPFDLSALSQMGDYEMGGDWSQCELMFPRWCPVEKIP